ncbi:hypothetical protein DES52_11848 [Deinococcus yavapaiensis KR-236]|uniref:Uncharacterized protein n=1 Tax=Deinococcus yavapaiensis KR-236 TaxID=694435 RepID=A0A318S6S0_9DEIO|nr:hypothetical protein DES52_11848 [Deinococcus yavapaiensis KR-236]
MSRLLWVTHDQRRGVKRRQPGYPLQHGFSANNATVHVDELVRAYRERPANVARLVRYGCLRAERRFHRFLHHLKQAKR